MMRAAFRPLVRSSMQHTGALRPVGQTFQPLAALSRNFASKPKVEDGTLEGRYATALFMASKNVDKVYGDLVGLRSMISESADFKLFVETPGIDPESKIASIQAICNKAGYDDSVANFMKVLVENKRLKSLPRMIDLYEVFYRAEKGLISCTVTSAAELTSAQKKATEAALKKRAGAGATLIMEYDTNPNLLGGLVCKMGEAVYDNSVATRLERLQTQLLAPLA